MMAGTDSERWGSRLIGVVALAFLVMVSVHIWGKEILDQKVTEVVESHYLTRISNSKAQPGRFGHEHVWPEMKFGWKIVVGTMIGFLGAAFGSVGGVGGGGIFVPMLTLIIGFDQKSSTAMSKCMIMGGAGATVFYNLRQRHPTLELPVIDYDLALLFQPMLVLGISIGVTFNVIFAEWMITVLLIIIFLVMSTKAFLKGVETWKKETVANKEVAQHLQSNGIANEEVEPRPLPERPTDGSRAEETKDSKRSKNYTETCSAAYWVLNLLQIPVAAGVTLYESVSLYRGRRVIASKAEASTNWRVHQLVFYCAGGIVAGIVGGLLGLGGGFILGPLFLEMGIPPQVSSATATFAMAFSSSLSVVEYYLLKRFPVPYAIYFCFVAIIAALVGQHVVTKVIAVLGRASLIIFVLAATIFVSAISLGGVGIARMVDKIEHKDYLGFESLCIY
ncbi:sulfite exporter TauE/SafE family protein 3-like isoform X3 [Carya illinoinensis]|uniref:sulfite exporter TauE/SafE family protein 3-like isoform X3 n=1 Tax=Carya illinoinensis TaxID=32201 RepID=UPI001C71DD80|nr:sulfite exporter TauE/SafE family protein 3-like isoform X3 [Carya illinoinensis]